MDVVVMVKEPLKIIKGDANEDIDPAMVPARNVVGKACFHVPYFGYLSQFVKTPLGFILLLCVPGVIAIVMETKNVRRLLTELKWKGNTG